MCALFETGFVPVLCTRRPAMACVRSISSFFAKQANPKVAIFLQLEEVEQIDEGSMRDVLGDGVVGLPGHARFFRVGPWCIARALAFLSATMTICGS